VLLVAESIYGGTWASGAPPEEFVDFEICLAFHISWQVLQEMPPYIRRVWWDLLCARREAENRAQRR